MRAGHVAAASIISRDDIERRVLRAILTLRAQPDREAGWQRVKALWPGQFDVMASLVKAQMLRPDRSKPRLKLRASDLDDFHVGPEDYEPVRHQFQPTHADVTDYLTALGWAATLTQADYRIVCLVAFEWDFRSIGRREGRDDVWARNRYAAAILQCWRKANASALHAIRARAR